MRDSLGLGSRLKVLTQRTDRDDLDLTLDEDGRAFIAPIATASRLVLYEGLPHRLDERTLFEAERRDKATVTLHDFAFYRAPLTVSAGDEEALGGFLGTAARSGRGFGPKLCGEFHPDYLAELHDRRGDVSGPDLLRVPRGEGVRLRRGSASGHHRCGDREALGGAPQVPQESPRVRRIVMWIDERSH